MTVKELIKQLEVHDPTAQIVVEVHDDQSGLDEWVRLESLIGYDDQFVVIKPKPFTEQEILEIRR